MLLYFCSSCGLALLEPLFSTFFCPISLLPIISEITEKIIHDRIMEYETHNKALYRCQLGFYHSNLTDTCLTYLADKMPTGLTFDNLTHAILINLQKTFNTIIYEIMLNKYSLAGFWVVNVTSLVRVFKSNANFSTFTRINCVVPLGSILGFLLIYRISVVLFRQQIVTCSLCREHLWKFTTAGMTKKFSKIYAKRFQMHVMGFWMTKLASILRRREETN